jgi:peptidoglycan/xylan/chitin deacetylase (PgdA/CDA1 family)
MVRQGNGLGVYVAAAIGIGLAGFVRPASQSPSIGPRVPVLEYHLVRARAGGQYIVSRDAFRADLALLYERGYRPITVAQLIDRDFRDVPVGMSPVVFTFDDASPEQFSYVERDGVLEIDSTSVIGIWLEFQKTHPDWKSRATFCLLSGAQAGNSFFGDSTRWNGQRADWRFRKLRWLVDQGFELCNHTVWHGQLSTFSDAMAQEQIARGQLAIDSAVPGYKVRTFALPLGLWPKTRELAWRGSWTDRKSGKTTTYDHDMVLEVAGGEKPSPLDSAIATRRLRRFFVFDGNLGAFLDRLDAAGTRFRRSDP